MSRCSYNNFPRGSDLAVSSVSSMVLYDVILTASHLAG